MTERAVPRLGSRAATLLFLLALAARLVAIAHFGFSTVRFGDAPAYLSAARELVRTGSYPRATEPFYFRAPGYPFFLVAATLGHPDRIAAAKVANAILGSASVLLLAALSARLFRRQALAIATGTAAALHPGFLFLSADVQSEPLFLLLLLGAGFLLLAAVDRPSSNLAVAAGLALALAALTRPSALALLPLAAAPLFDRRYPLRARGHLAASALLGFLFALAPWTLRNARVYHEFLPINDAGGSAFYQGNSDWMVRFYELQTPDQYRRWSQAMFADLERQTRAIDASSGGSPAAKSRYFVRKTFEERRGDPAGWAKLLLRKAWDWLRPYPNPLFWPAWVVWAIGALYALITILAFVGLAVAPRPGVRLFVLAYLALTLASHVALIVVWRYRIPYWDPVLILYSVFGAGRIGWIGMRTAGGP
jgi:4-amino-4-deoxy-L-arabinose transferase-like glycosyltransferase